MFLSELPVLFLLVRLQILRERSDTNKIVSLRIASLFLLSPEKNLTFCSLTTCFSDTRGDLLYPLYLLMFLRKSTCESTTISAAVWVSPPLCAHLGIPTQNCTTSEKTGGTWASCYTAATKRGILLTLLFLIFHALHRRSPTTRILIFLLILSIGYKSTLLPMSSTSTQARLLSLAHSNLFLAISPTSRDFDPSSVTLNTFSTSEN